MDPNAAELARQLMEPQALFAVLPAVFVALTVLFAVGFLVGRLSAPPRRASAPAPRPQPPAQSPPPPPDPETEKRLQEALARLEEHGSETAALEQKLTAAQGEIDREKALNQELQGKVEQLKGQLGEILREVEQIYHQNSGISALEELNQRIGSLKDGAPAPRSPAPAPVTPSPDGPNPEKLLISEQAAEIRKLKDVVAYYQQKYGE